MLKKPPIEISPYPVEHVKRAAETLTADSGREAVGFAITLLRAAFDEILGPLKFSSSPTWSIVGFAIDPAEAAKCMDDRVRTHAFIRGFHAAVRECREKFHERIEVLYAGCGPYAALAVPVASLFSPDELHVTAIDMHAQSVECAGKIAERLKLDDRFTFVVGDALEYKPHRPPHIIMTETMSYALLNEPQAAITGVLTNYLREGGVFLPEEVTVDAILKSWHVEELRDNIELGTVARLTKETKQSLEEALEGLVQVTLVLPDCIDGPHWVELHTVVRVFKNICIRPGYSPLSGESSITMPHRFKSFVIDERHAGKKVFIEYEFGGDPDYAIAKIID